MFKEFNIYGKSKKFRTNEKNETMFCAWLPVDFVLKVWKKVAQIKKQSPIDGMTIKRFTYEALNKHMEDENGNN